MATVENLLELYQLNGLKVIAGEGGLHNHVGTVTVMEVPEAIKFLRGDDFLITSLYAIGNDESKQAELVNDLIETKSACLAIKLGKYAESVSDKAIEIAEKYKFPILLIPGDMTYIQIIMSVMNVILTEKNMDEILEKYVQDVLFEMYNDEKIMVDRARFLGIDIRNNVFQSIVIKPIHKDLLDDFKFKVLKFMAKQIASYIRELQCIKTCSLLMLEDSAILLLEATTEQELEKSSTYLKDELVKRMKSSTGNTDLKIGIGNVEGDLKGIRHSYETALHAIRTGAILDSTENIFVYKKLAMYCQLQEMLLNMSVSFYDQVLGKIDSPELISTLEIYFDCNGSMEQTAQVMFTHKNTIKYRINKIKELTGLDVKKQEDNFKLYMMLLEKKLKN